MVRVLLASVPSILVIGLSVLWLRSHWVQDRFDFGLRRRQGSIVSSGGSLWATVLESNADDWGLSLNRSSTRMVHPFRPLDENSHTWYGELGFGMTKREYHPLGAGFFRGTVFVRVTVWLPDWCPLLLAAPFAYLSMVRRARRYRCVVRERDRRCHMCGYDLRATPGRCPECGTMPARTAEGEREN